jgi:uracil-DNA glycosylase family 4
MLDKEKNFKTLSKSSSLCRLCPAMSDLPAILSSKNGSLDTDLIFIAEAPGRFGSGRTGIPFHGDRSGDNFEQLLNYVDIKRKDIFITNAVLCNPLKDGNNRRPTTKEINNCIPFLENLINIITPKIISTVGGVGLEAINRIFKTHYKLADVVATPLPIGQFILFPLYHPSPRVIHTKRSLDQQKKDFKKLFNNLPPSSQLRVSKEQSQNN